MVRCIGKLKVIFMGLLILFLTACVSFVPEQNKDKTPESNMAYLAGSYAGVGLFGFVLRNMDTGEEVNISLDAGPIFFGTVDENFIIYPLNPGRYDIIKWFRYTGDTNQVMGGYNNVTSKLGWPFKLEKNQIGYLGRFELFVDNEYQGFRPKLFTEKEVLELRDKFYPYFSDVPVVCIFC